jgi:hypothetical protein
MFHMKGTVPAVGGDAAHVPPNISALLFLDKAQPMSGNVVSGRGCQLATQETQRKKERDQEKKPQAQSAGIPDWYDAARTLIVRRVVRRGDASSRMSDNLRRCFNRRERWQQSQELQG